MTLGGSGGPGGVSLRDVSDDDLPIFYEYQLDPDATRMAAFPARDWDAHMAHWHKILRHETVVARTILVAGQVAGNIVSWEQGGEREVGYWIGRHYWGQGAATTALSQFLQLVRARPLYAHVAEHNVGSLRVLEKCGFTVDTEKHQGNVEEVVLLLRS